MASKDVFVARAIVRPTAQKVPIQIINPGVETVKLYKVIKIGNLQQADNVTMNDPVLDEKDSVIQRIASFNLIICQPKKKLKWNSCCASTKIYLQRIQVS